MCASAVCPLGDLGGKGGGIFMESGAKNVFYFRPTICVHEAHESIFHEKIKN